MKGLTFALVLVGFTFTAFAGFEDYKPSTIASVLEAHPDDPTVDHLYEPGTEAFRFKVTYAGARRKIGADARRHVEKWTRTTGKDDNVTAMFSHEILVREGKAEYWLPVQEQLLEAFDREVSANGRLEIFAVWVGYARHVPLFLVGEFAAE